MGASCSLEVCHIARQRAPNGAWRSASRLSLDFAPTLDRRPKAEPPYGELRTSEVPKCQPSGWHGENRSTGSFGSPRSPKCPPSGWHGENRRTGSFGRPRSPKCQPSSWHGENRSTGSFGRPRSPKCQPSGWHGDKGARDSAAGRGGATSRLSASRRPCRRAPAAGRRTARRAPSLRTTRGRRHSRRAAS